MNFHMPLRELEPARVSNLRNIALARTVREVLGGHDTMPDTTPAPAAAA